MTFDDVRRIALGWPDVEDGTSYGTAALRVRGKLLTRLYENGDSLVVKGVDLDEREMRLGAEPDVFHPTDHYRERPIVLVRLSTAEAKHVTPYSKPTLAALSRSRASPRRPRDAAYVRSDPSCWRSPKPASQTASKVSWLAADLDIAATSPRAGRRLAPAGVFAMPATQYGDQVVDGGYFENSGLTTALNIVAAMDAADANLHPILVSIANDPELGVPSDADLDRCKAAGLARGPQVSLGDCSSLPRRPTTTPLVLPADTSLGGRIFGFLSRPLQTLLSTGNGHADEALGAAEAAVPSQLGAFYRLKVDVTPDLTPPARPSSEEATRCDKLWGHVLTMAKVSMSWWLSASVQADLDAQRCSSDNRAVLDKLLGAAPAGAPPL